MSTLIAVAGLGVASLLLEILNLRKILVPVVLIGLVGILGMTVFEIYDGQSLLLDKYNMIVSTSFSKAFSVLFTLITLFIIMMSPSFYSEKMENEKIADYVSIKLFILAGAVAMVSFGNFAMFFIGLEVLSIGAYVLAASKPKDLRSNEAGVKYFIMGAFASGFILFGIALVYGALASFDTSTVMKVSSEATTLPTWFYIGFVMIVVGLLFKISAVPFHFWAPDVYEGSPTLVTGLMSTLIKVAALAALYKVLSILFVGITPAFQCLLVGMSILTMTVGNITALKQKSIKRMMAYSGISHAGFMMMYLLTIASNGSASASGLLYYAAAYSLSGLAAFAVIMAVCKNKENEDISNFYGLAKHQPILAFSLAGSLMSLGGIPIFSGFFAKFFVLQQMQQNDFLILVIFGIINSIIAIYYYFGVVNGMYTKERVSEEKLQVPTTYKIVALISVILSLILGICPSLVMGLTL